MMKAKRTSKQNREYHLRKKLAKVENFDRVTNTFSDSENYTAQEKKWMSELIEHFGYVYQLKLKI